MYPRKPRPSGEYSAAILNWAHSGTWDLAEDLDRQGIRTRKRKLNTGQNRGGVRFGVGYPAMMLRNRFYIGEVAHRGQIHPGEQQPILDRGLFNAVQD